MSLIVLILLSIWTVALFFGVIIPRKKGQPAWKMRIINFAYVFWGIILCAVPNMGVFPTLAAMLVMLVLVRQLERRFDLFSSYPKWRQFVHCGSFMLWGYVAAAVAEPYAAAGIN